jgi:dTDP-4-amino-4,6-dideoxygalactose transaminase
LATSLTSGVIPVNLWGRTVDIDAVMKEASARKLVVVFDSSHAFGCTYQGKPVGGFGNAEVFSFHATKFVNTFEGGAVATNDDELAERIRLMQNFGFSDRDQVIHVGINAKMNEVEAAMGLTSLEAMEGFIAHNYENYCAYLDGLRCLDGIRLVEYDASERNNYQYIVIEVDDMVTGLHRDHLLRVLQMEGVDARRYFYPGCHRMEPYSSRPEPKGQDLKRTDETLDRVLTLPTGTAVSPDEIRRIVTLMQSILERRGDVACRLATHFEAARLTSLVR